MHSIQPDTVMLFCKKRFFHLQQKIDQHMARENEVDEYNLLIRVFYFSEKKKPKALSDYFAFKSIGC
jgi:hypothetical protein